MTQPIKTTAASTNGGELSERIDLEQNPGDLRMFYYIPAGLPQNAPLVVVLHGGNQSAADYAVGAGWLSLADRFGFALLCPEQTARNNSLLCFNWFALGDTRRGEGEAASIFYMIQSMVADHQLAIDRVYITGLSAGAAMTAVMLATYPEVFSAGAMISGLPYGAATGPWAAALAMLFDSGRAARDWGDRVREASQHVTWPSISIWHGSLDTTVRPGASNDLVQQWTNVHGVESPPTRRITSDGREYLIWSSADGRKTVEQHAIAGMAHGAPVRAGGLDGCGVAGRYHLEVGISSSLEIATTWALHEK